MQMLPCWLWHFAHVMAAEHSGSLQPHTLVRSTIRGECHVLLSGQPTSNRDVSLSHTLHLLVCHAGGSRGTSPQAPWITVWPSFVPPPPACTCCRGKWDEPSGTVVRPSSKLKSLMAVQAGVVLRWDTWAGFQAQGVTKSEGWPQERLVLMR